MTGAVVWASLNFNLWPIGALFVIAAIIGVFVFLYLTRSPFRPTTVLVILSPLEGVLMVLLGLVSNLVTPLVVVAFLFSLRSRILQVFFGTRIQQLSLLFLMSMLPSFMPGLLGLNTSSYLAIGQRAALVIILGVVAYSMSDVSHVAKLAKMLVISSAIVSVIAISSFYTGDIGLTPITQVTSAIHGEIGLLGGVDINTFRDNPVTTDLRLRGVQNSTEINRFAMWLLLPIFAAIGWVLTSRSILPQFIALLCVIVLTTALLGTASRSGILGLILGLGAMSLVGFRTSGRWRLIFGMIAVFSIPVFYILTQTDVGVVANARIVEGWLNPGERVPIWTEAVSRMWSPKILSGAGSDTFGKLGATDVFTYGSAHNAYLQLAIENGIVSAVLFLAITVRSIYILSRSSGSADRNSTFWQHAFLGGLIAMLVSNMFNVYTFERFIWIALGFAVALEFREKRQTTETVRQTSLV